MSTKAQKVCWSCQSRNIGCWHTCQNNGLVTLRSLNLPSTSKRGERSGLHPVAQHVLGTCYVLHATENHTIQKRVTAQTSNLCWESGPKTAAPCSGSLGCAAKSAPEMTHGRTSSEPVLPEASSHDLPLGYAGYGPPIKIWSCFPGALMVSLDRVLHLRHKHSHVLGKSCTRLAEPHHSAPRMMLALPRNFVRSTLLRARRNRFSTSLLSRGPTFPL